MFSRRSFLAWLPAFLCGVSAAPRLVDAVEIDRSRSGPVSKREAVPKLGVYVVKKATLEAQPGDHVIVRDSHSALHRYLGYLDLKAMLQSGALEWVRDITPTSSGAIRTVTHRSILRLVR